MDQIKNVNGDIGTPPLADDGPGYQSFGGSGSTQGKLKWDFKCEIFADCA